MKKKIARWYAQGLWTAGMVRNAVKKGILSAQCFYRTPCEGVLSAGEEEAVWAAVQDRYEKALGQLNPVVKDDLDRYLMERLLVTLTRVRQRRWSEA